MSREHECARTRMFRLRPSQMLPCNGRPLSRRVQDQVAPPMALGHLHLAQLFAGEREVEVRVSEVWIQRGGISKEDEGGLILGPIVQHISEVEASLGVRRLERDGPREAPSRLVQMPLPIVQVPQ